jgi:hypothetical protein
VQLKVWNGRVLQWFEYPANMQSTQRAQLHTASHMEGQDELNTMQRLGWHETTTVYSFQG